MFLFHPLFGICSNRRCNCNDCPGGNYRKNDGEKLGEANTLAAKANMSFQSNLRNAEVIEAMGMASSIRSKIEGLYDEVSSKQAIASDKAGLLRALSKSFRVISQSALLGLGAFLALNGEISPGTDDSWLSFIGPSASANRYHGGLMERICHRQRPILQITKWSSNIFHLNLIG